jgi:hypothetical protein
VCVLWSDETRNIKIDNYLRTLNAGFCLYLPLMGAVYSGATDSLLRRKYFYTSLGYFTDFGFAIKV